MVSAKQVSIGLVQSQLVVMLLVSLLGLGYFQSLNAYCALSDHPSDSLSKDLPHLFLKYDRLQVNACDML